MPAKRVKRDPVKRAYNHGYSAGLKGLSDDACPFSELDKRGSWFGGWRLGREDMMQGLTCQGLSYPHEVDAHITLMIASQSGQQNIQH